MLKHILRRLCMLLAMKRYLGLRCLNSKSYSVVAAKKWQILPILVASALVTLWNFWIVTNVWRILGSPLHPRIRTLTFTKTVFSIHLSMDFFLEQRTISDVYYCQCITVSWQFKIRNYRKSSLGKAWIFALWSRVALRATEGGLENEKFENDIQVGNFVGKWLLTPPTNSYNDIIKILPVRRQKCLQHNGEYVEK